MIPKYPEIALLYRRPEIFSVKEVVATEKLHGCVVAKTRVSMADGSAKAISTLVVGDQILGVDGGGHVTTSEVTHVYKNGRAEKWLKIIGPRRGAGRGSHEFVLRCTPEHHVWHVGKRTYVTAGALQVGDRVTMLRSELGLTPLQQQVLLGKMLGDGSLAIDHTGGSAHVSWGQVEGDYSRWTSRALGDLDSGTEDERTSGHGSLLIRRRTVNNAHIKELLKDFIVDGIKHVPEWVASHLTPIALAFWYMDDGSLGHTEGQEDRAQFATCAFNKQDCGVLIRALARLGIEASLSDNADGYPRIVLGTDAAEALFLLVAPYIPRSMSRKLPERYRGHDGWLPTSENAYKPMLTEQTISYIGEDTEISSMRYDIETTTHNYFANGMLVHNSNFRVHFPLGMTTLADVRYGSHDVEDTEATFPLGKAKLWFEARPDLLTAMWEVIKSYGFSDATVFGEAYGPGIKAKGVKYSDGTEMLFRAFDIMVGENFVTHDLFVEVTDKMKLPRVHEVWRGEPTQANFDALLEQMSIEGKINGIDDPTNLAEGVVIRSNPLLRNVFGEWLIAKHKSKRFTEKAEAPVVKERTTSPADTFAATFVTEGRITNAVGRLADRGNPLVGDMKDMPALLTEIIADLHKECESEWKETGMPDGTMKGAVSKVLGPLYRKIITESA